MRGKVLAFLEQSFKAAGLDIEFGGRLSFTPGGFKVVGIYQCGCLDKKVNIEGNALALAAKAVAEGVELW